MDSTETACESTETACDKTDTAWLSAEMAWLWTDNVLENVTVTTEPRFDRVVDMTETACERAE